jgi:hypothetical protein
LQLPLPLLLLQRCYCYYPDSQRPQLLHGLHSVLYASLLYITKSCTLCAAAMLTLECLTAAAT